MIIELKVLVVADTLVKNKKIEESQMIGNNNHNLVLSNNLYHKGELKFEYASRGTCVA